MPIAAYAVLPSIEAIEPLLAESGWELNFRQLDSGMETAAVQATATADTALLSLGLSNRTHQRARPLAGCITFGLPTGPQAPGRLGDRPLESETITCFEDAGGLDAVTLPGFEAFTISVSHERLQDGLLARGAHIDVSSLQGQQRAPDPERLKHLRNQVSELMSVSLSEELDTLRRNRLCREIDNAILTLILDAWECGEDIPPERVGHRQRSLRRALAYIEAHPREALTVESICQESACSLSTLERAFREYFCVSPKRYLMRYRLQQVRRTLKQASNAQRDIAAVASDFGFWHMSKFAADYRRMFGELPSATKADPGLAA